MVKQDTSKTSMSKIASICFLLLFSSMVFGQLSDLAKIDYTYVPKGDTNVGYSRARALFNYPVKLKEDKYLFLGLNYSNIELSFDSSVDAFNTEVIQDFQLLDFIIAYTFKVNEDWRFGARFSPGYSSNLVKNISIEDVVFAADIVFINNKKNDENVTKPYQLILGISYSENRGIPFPIPFISYYRKFDPKWSFKIGIPKSNLQYHLSEKSRFKLVAELDGFTANIQNGLLVNENEIADMINMSIVIGGLRYEYKFSKNIELFCSAANIFFSNAELQDNKSKKIISVNKKNTFYLRTGIRFKL